MTGFYLKRGVNSHDFGHFLVNLGQEFLVFFILDVPEDVGCGLFQDLPEGVYVLVPAEDQGHHVVGDTHNLAFLHAAKKGNHLRVLQCQGREIRGERAVPMR